MLLSNSLVVKFPYLVQKKLKEGQEVRRVSQLDWKIIENDCKKPFVASGLELVPLPVSCTKSIFTVILDLIPDLFPCYILLIFLM